MPASPENPLSGIAFSYTWWGHMLTGTFVGAAIIALSAVLSWIGHIPIYLSPFLAAMMISILTVETVGTVIDRWYAKRGGRLEPGGWLPTVTIPILYCVIFPAFSFLLAGRSTGMVVLVASVLISVPYTLWLQPWKAGLSIEEERERGRAVRKMTREEFRLDKKG